MLIHMYIISQKFEIIFLLFLYILFFLLILLLIRN